MKKRSLNNQLNLKKITISNLKKSTGGITTSDIYTSRFADLCYGAHTSYVLVCAYQCAPTGI